VGMEMAQHFDYGQNELMTAVLTFLQLEGSLMQTEEGVGSISIRNDDTMSLMIED
jgi:hypothetical protein